MTASPGQGTPPPGADDDKQWPLRLPREVTVTVAVQPMSDGETLHLVEVVDHTIYPPQTPGGEPVNDFTMADHALCDEWMSEQQRVAWDDPTRRCRECVWVATR